MYTPRGKPAAVAKTLTTESAPQDAVRAVASTVMSKPLYLDQRINHRHPTPSW